MKNNSKSTIMRVLLISFISVWFISCSEDNLGHSIFDTNDYVNDPTSATYSFDMWLNKAYLNSYNLSFMYKMEDVASDMSYNLVPAKLDKAEEMAKLIKYLWFDVYDKVAGADFLKEHGPRIIHLIGSPAYNASGSETLGTAEGGIKITLYKCNEVNRGNTTLLNEYYFRTMHHEFAHILHQKKSYPTDFALISKGYYNATMWHDVSVKDAASLGFVTRYAGKEPHEDFVEVIANYITRTDAEWQSILSLAASTSNEYDIDGKAVIEEKLEMVTSWLRDSWGLNIEDIRQEVLSRQENILNFDKDDEYYQF